MTHSRVESTNKEFDVKTGKKANVLMFGPHLNAMSGISNVVNNWIRVGIKDAVNLDCISTIDDCVPGQYVIKTSNVESIVNTFTIGVLNSASIHGEGISNSITEYMALGKPVIATDCGGNRELVEDGEND